MFKYINARFSWATAIFVIANIFLMQSVFAIPSPWLKRLDIVNKVADNGATVLGKAGDGSGKILDYINGVAARMGKAESCWKKSYGRGVGTVADTCPSDQERDGLLCYPKCNWDYNGIGPVCWGSCPSGSTSQGPFCDVGGAGCGGSFWGIRFPGCPSGTSGCRPSCMKKSYGRGAGYPLSCPSGKQYDAGLCYNSCAGGYSGVGPVCWGQCPAGLTNCGAFCASSSGQCASEIGAMVAAPLTVIANITGMVFTGGSAVAATKAAKAAQIAAKTGQKAAEIAIKLTLKAAFKSAMKAVAKETAKSIVKAVGTSVSVQIGTMLAKRAKIVAQEAGANPERYLDSVSRTVAISAATELIKEQAKSMADEMQEVFSDPLFWPSVIDPTGVVDLVLAFKKPDCSAVALPDDIDVNDLPKKDEVDWYLAAYDRETAADAEAAAVPLPTLIPTITPTPLPTATPVPAATSTPVPAATSTPVPAATSTPVPAATSTPVPAATSTTTYMFMGVVKNSSFDAKGNFIPSVMAFSALTNDEDIQNNGSKVVLKKGMSTMGYSLFVEKVPNTTNQVFIKYKPYATAPVKCLDFDARTAGNNGNVQLWDCVPNAPNQRYTITRDGDYARIKNGNTMCMGYDLEAMRLKQAICDSTADDQRFNYYETTQRKSFVCSMGVCSFR